MSVCVCVCGLHAENDLWSVQSVNLTVCSDGQESKRAVYAKQTGQGQIPKGNPIECGPSRFFFSSLFGFFKGHTVLPEYEVYREKKRNMFVICEIDPNRPKVLFTPLLLLVFFFVAVWVNATHPESHVMRSVS